MKLTNIYQTVENRGNNEEIIKHGPFFCSVRNNNGILKRGVKEPWLGEGYYFWDTRIEDARWWGNTVYQKNGYVICHTTYDQHSHLLYDLVGDVKHYETFMKCAKLIKEKMNVRTLKFSVVLSYLKRDPNFNYKAIRVWPQGKNSNSSVVLSTGEIVMKRIEKVQICFFDKTLLSNAFRIVETV